MAVANRITKAQPAKSKSITYMSNGMQVDLTPEVVRTYMVSGPAKDSVSLQEVAMFMQMCKYSGLNPWLKEAYCIKYGSEPATMVTGKEAFLKRAEKEPSYDGFKAGIAVLDESGNYSYREGAIVIPGETLIGGWAEVFRKDRENSTRIEVGFEEYASRTKDGTLNKQWKSKPATMIRKVALVQALREAFSTTFGGMETAEELGHDEPDASVGIPAPIMDQSTGEIASAEIVPPEPERPEPVDPGESLI